MKKGIQALICLVAVAAGLAIAAPIMRHKAQKNEEQTLTRQSEALSNIRYHMIRTLQPSIENKRWMRVKKSQYLSMRNYRGYTINMDEHLGVSTTTIREALEKQVIDNLAAIRDLEFASRMYHEGQGFKLRTFESLHDNYNTDNPDLSPEVQLFAVNMAGSVDALMRGTSLNDIDPSFFIFDSKGKMSPMEELQFRIDYHNMYEEYWIDYFLNDDAHIYRPTKEELKYTYIF